jgi:KDO2-lipid IV(A) lauroyltransferase
VREPAAGAAPPAEASTGETPRAGLGDLLEYVLVRALTFALLCTDLRGAARIGSALGTLLAAVDLRHRRVAEDNLRRAYGGSLPERSVRRIAWRVYERLGITAAEVAHGPRRIRGGAAKRWFTVTGVEEARRFSGGKPILFVGGHLGNWEHLIPAAKSAGLEVLTVARPLDNPLLDRWVTEIRHAVGHYSVPKAGALRGLVRTVREGKNVGMLLDQNGGRHGTLARFFGRPCSTQSAGISLARRLGIPFCVGHLERRAPGFHRLAFGRPVYVRDDDAGEQEAVEEMNRQLEERVRRRPEDWMWLHRRWRIKADWGFPVEPTEGRRRKA